MNTVEKHFAPTVLQEAIGEPLRSEQRTTDFLPRVLSPLDMLVIFIAIVLFIPDGTVVQVTQQAGGAAYIFWLIGAATFLLRVPSSPRSFIVCYQRKAPFISGHTAPLAHCGASLLAFVPGSPACWSCSRQVNLPFPWYKVSAFKPLLDTQIG